MFYYAVRKGREPGIYTKWRDAERQIYLFTGAQFKKFDSREKAEAFMRNDPTPPSSPEPSSPHEETESSSPHEETEEERKERLYRQFPDRDKHETIHIKVEKTNNSRWDVQCRCTGQNYFFFHTISQKEYKTPAMAGLYGLCCLLNKWCTDSPYRPYLTIRIEKKRKQNNMYYIKNVIDKYLKQWAANLWYSTHGPVKQVELMKNLYDRVQEFPYIHCIIVSVRD